MTKTKYIARCRKSIGSRYCWNVSLNYLLKTMKQEGWDINDFNFYIETDAGEMELILPDELKQNSEKYKELQNRLHDVCVERANLKWRIEEAIKILDDGEKHDS